tara:strand:- start:2303 stop:2833 length:531 start_codon:yes stop_codon:yes gene_type:complete
MIEIIEQAFDPAPFYEDFIENYEFVRKMQGNSDDDSEIRTWGKPLLFAPHGIKPKENIEEGWKPLWEIIKPQIEAFTGHVKDPEIAYINLFQHGDNSQIHRDWADYTAICYMNPNWNYNLGGETMFYDGDKPKCTCVLPIGGNVVIFDGQIDHKAGFVSSYAQEGRMGLTYMFNKV